jgi:ferric-dicitrate binding protein FerR (iron transport regulator)
VEQIPEHIESILAALFSGAATDTEVNTLREWVNASDEHKNVLAKYRKTHYLLRSYEQRDKYASEEAWKKLSILLKKDASLRSIRWIKRTGRYAAILILAFGAGMVTMHYAAHPSVPEEVTPDEAADFYTEYTVPYGSKSMITMPDSSSIWLNAGSKLRYSSSFNRTNREVFIEGEAYFKVAKNEKKPFMVKTSAVTLKVMGTSFNIKAYPEEKDIETTVETGTVQVLRNVEGQLMDKLVLTAGQKVTVIKSTARIDSTTATKPLPLPAPLKAVMPEEIAEKTIVTKNVTPELYTSWKDKRWIIEKESLEKLAVKLERRYNVQISFQDDRLKNFSFSGTLEDETLEQVLEVIKLSAPISYTVRQNKVKLTRNKWITN